MYRRHAPFARQKGERTKRAWYARGARGCVFSHSLEGARRCVFPLSLDGCFAQLPSFPRTPNVIPAQAGIQRGGVSGDDRILTTFPL